jgi:hypothetical protein
LFSNTRITIKGVNGTGTNLKKITEETESPRNQSKALNKNRLSLLLKFPDCFFAGFFAFFDAIFVAIILNLLVLVLLY